MSYVDTTSSWPVEDLVSVQRTFSQSVTFPCTSEFIENTDWWFQDSSGGAVHQISSAGQIINSFKADGRFSLGKGFTGDTSLSVRNLSQFDSGVYICRTDNDVQHKFQLTVACTYFINNSNKCTKLRFIHMLTAKCSD